jgi:hypothetical protein
MRTVQRAFAELTGEHLLTDGKPGAKSTRSGVIPSEPAAVTIARRELAQLEEQIGTSPTGDDAQRLHAEYKDRLAAAISLAQMKPTASLPIVDGTDDTTEVDIPVVSRSITPDVTPASPVVTTDEKNREQLSFLVKRLNSLSEALQQLVDGKAKWSAYAQYAEVVSLGEKLADLVKLLSEPDPVPTPKPTTDDAALTAEEIAETKALADKRKADNAAYRTAHTCHLCGKQFKRKYHSAKRHETTYKHDDESTCVVRDGEPTNIRLMAASAALKARQECEAAWQAEYEKEEGSAK